MRDFCCQITFSIFVQRTCISLGLAFYVFLFWFSLDYLVLVLFAVVVLGLITFRVRRSRGLY